jgi:hypothetical protein
MTEPKYVSRRTVLSMALGSVLAVMTSPFSHAQAQPIVVNTSGVKDVGDLIGAIRQSGEGFLPKLAPDESFFAPMAKAFVEHARETAEKHGIQVPSWILDHLPEKNGAPDRPDRTDAMASIAILGVAFVLPRLFLLSIVLVSIVVMSKYIADEIRKLRVTST